MKKTNRQILVIDDDSVTRKLISHNLEKEGYTVFDADSSKNGLTLIKKHNIDLVFCDVMMDDMDGFEFCKLVRQDERYQALPFVFITARTSNEDKIKALNLGADDFISKPVNIQDLLLKTSSILKRVEIYRVYGIRKKFEETFSEKPFQILLVDDDPIILKILSVTFIGAGYDCLIANNAQEGFALARIHNPDLILSDYMMPDVDGFGFRKMLSNDNRLAHIPFIFLTANDQDNVVMESFDMDIKDFISKTTNPRLVAAKVGNVLKTIRKERQNTLLELQEAADSISMEVVPKNTPSLDGFEIIHWHVPFKGMPGGDFIDYIELDEDNLVVILGDVMGKKWGAWFFTFSFIGYLRSAIRVVLKEQKVFSAKEVLKKVNESIYDDAKISEIFTTVSLVIVNKKTKEVQYSGAGDLGLLYYDEDSKHVKPYQSEGMLLGARQDGDYDTITMSLKHHDSMFVLTDGVIESRNKQGEQYGMERLVKTIEESAELPNQFEYVKEKFLDFTGGVFDDDVSMIAIRCD